MEKFLVVIKGKITSNNGLTLLADNFEYNKSSKLLKANGNIKIEDKINKYIIFTDSIEYFKEKNIIVTYNNSKAINLDNKIQIEAKSFEVDRSQNKIIAEEKVFINDELNNTELFTDKVTYLQDQEKFITEGNSKAINLDNKIKLRQNLLKLIDLKIK